MNKSIIAISTILALFLLNIILYSQSENYRFFIQKIKNQDDIVYPNQGSLDDSVLLIQQDDLIEEVPTQQEQEILETATLVSRDETNTIIETKPEPITPTSQVILGQNYQNILNLFSEYNLGKLQLHSNLFDVTDEYPDEYHEYYSPDLTLYLFPTKTYQDMLDIFNVQPDLPIEINPVDNFGDESFFINFIPTDTRNVRIVINHESSVFGLKIKKDEYNAVKQILNNL